jgi:hypothetical protein
MWTAHPSDEYSKRQKKLEKRHLRELQAVLANAQRYLQALQQGTKPKQIQGGWIHPEPHDVVALDQRGGHKKDGGKNLGRGLVEMRLYVYPQLAQEILHLITLGLKDTQTIDIKYSTEYVQQLEEEQQREGGKNENLSEHGGPSP